MEDLLYISELSREARSTLQVQTAEKYKLELSFQDKLKSGGLGPEMAVIPKGIFLMGAASDEIAAKPNEYPQHYEKIEHDFAIGRYLITAEDFALFQKATGFRFSEELFTSTGAEPVINVRFQEVEEYLAWLSQETGQRYRLPTEAEWEYAARAGTTTPFFFGDDASCKIIHASPRREVGDKRKIQGPTCLRYPRPIPVGCFAYNPWGLYDVHGNVWEFTATPWREHYGISLQSHKPLIEQSEWVTVRGGSWFEPFTRCRSAARSKRLWSELDMNLGFRVVRDL